MALWSRGGPRLEETAARLRDTHGVDVHAIGADAGDAAAARTVWGAVNGAFGTLDILVLNSGGPPTVDPLGTEAEGWRRAFQLLAITPIELATLALPGMRERGWGRIVAVLSSTIRHPVPNLVYSTGGRLALTGWMKTAASATARDGVTINGVLPGRIDTDRVTELDRERAEREGRSLEELRAASEAAIPAGRYGRPDELAAMVAFLCGRPASYVTGAFIPIDGGSTQGF